MDYLKIALNKEQKLAVEAGAGPLLIVAGAGTGKTRTLTSRIAHFIERGMPPERICAITFTNKAANEMANRVAQIANRVEKAEESVRRYDERRATSNSPFIGTFHSLGARILRKEARLLGRKQNFVIFDDHDSFDLIKKSVKKLISAKNGGGIGATMRQEKHNENPSVFANKISGIKNISDYLNNLKSSSKPADVLAVKIFERYEAALEENNAFDFDDLIEKVVRLFGENPDVLKKYRSKFDAVLVDEYQDLNPAQYELVKLLAGGHKNISVVGDDEQMIYGWRHTDIRIFLDFEKNWPGARIVFLEENYRSTSNIIQAASAVAQNNEYRRPKNLWTQNPEGAPIKIFEATDENDEAEFIAKTIATGSWQLAASQRPDASGQMPSVAVLYRTNAQSRALEQALIRHKIPYQIFGGLRFYERREVKDAVAALRYALNPQDEISRDRLEKLVGKRKFPELKDKISAASTKKLSPTKIIELFLVAADYIKYLEEDFINYAERQENIAELLHFASRFEDLSQMLEEVALVQPLDTTRGKPTDEVATGDPEPLRYGASMGQGTRLKSGPSNIKHFQVTNLMTIHLAKGLEFDRVFIAGCSEGLLPHGRSLDNKYQLEEERRLMYVAMTRARSELDISFYDMPSRFLGEIPGELTSYEKPADLCARHLDEKIIFFD